ncbi:MAG TPA: helix-turn-helix domain-containing protein [Polyangiaceae bacterium]
MSELSRTFGISRKTVYRWLERYEQGGAAGLVERPPGTPRPSSLVPPSS